METKIKWNNGDGNIIAAYPGSGDAPIDISSDTPNEGIDREQTIQVATVDNTKSVDVLVKQTGLRQRFITSDGLVFCVADGGRFAVLKQGSTPDVPDEMFPATIVYTKDANANNARIANWLKENYPDMPYNIGGRYLPISDEIYIQGSLNCDGKVIGVAHWVGVYPQIILYTAESYAKFYGLRVLYDTFEGIEAGFTIEYFYD